jgi:hypothetical protein
MKFIIISIVILFSVIFYSVHKNQKQVIIKTDETEIVREEILEHRYLYQNGKVIEMTKKKITQKRQ